MEETKTVTTVEKTEKRVYFGRANYRGTLDASNWKPVYTKVLIAVQRGLESADIARNHGVSLSTVNRLRAEPFFLQKLQNINSRILDQASKQIVEHTINDKVRKILAVASLRAVLKIRKLSRSGTSKERLQFDACKDILDRAGYKPREVIETVERDYTPQEVEAALYTMREVEQISTSVVEKANPFLVHREMNTLSDETTPKRESIAAPTPSRDLPH